MVTAITGNTWMRVKVDGIIEFQGRADAGSAYTFNGDEKVEVLAANGSLVQIIYNGEDLGLMGDSGAIIEIIYTPQGTLFPTPTNTPTPTRTPRVTPTYTPSITPTAVQRGQAFVKSWRIKNVGTGVWTPQYQLAFTYGNNAQSAMGGSSTPLTKNVNPGETYDMNLNLVAPKDPGTYTAVWNLQNAEDVAFGESLWVAITVPGTPTVTVKPATTLDFDVKLISCKNNPTNEKPGGVILTLQFQPTGGTTPYRYFDMDEGKEVPQTYEREGSKGSSTIVAFGVLSADGQSKEKKIQFQPSSFGPAGCQ